MTDDNKTIGELDDTEIVSFVRNLVASTTINQNKKVMEHKKTFALPMADFPLVALEKFITYGMQRVFNDAIGGEAPLIKIDVVTGMIEDFKKGVVGKRRTGAPVDDVHKIARQLARIALKAVYAAQSLDFKEFTELDRDDQMVKLDKIVEGNEKLLVEAQKKIDARKAAQSEIDLGALGLATTDTDD